MTGEVIWLRRTHTSRWRCDGCKQEWQEKPDHMCAGRRTITIDVR